MPLAQIMQNHLHFRVSIRPVHNRCEISLNIAKKLYLLRIGWRVIGGQSLVAYLVFRQERSINAIKKMPCCF